LINPFEVPKGKEAAALKMREKAAEYMKKQPGFVSTRLHRALAPDTRFHLINIAEWESVENFQAAINSDEFKKLTEGSKSLWKSFRIIQGYMKLSEPNQVAQRGRSASLCAG
jgi:heme-degrading monooxygenase HmoA